VPPPFSLAFWFLPFKYIIWVAINFRHCGSHLKRRKPDEEILLRKLNRVVVLVVAVVIQCWIWFGFNIGCRNLVYCAKFDPILDPESSAFSGGLKGAVVYRTVLPTKCGSRVPTIGVRSTGNLGSPIVGILLGYKSGLV
jgi:hypothetical protein